MWHSEMYGYVFAAATVGVTHRVRRDVMLYPGRGPKPLAARCEPASGHTARPADRYEPFLGRAPPILHYGADYTLGRPAFEPGEKARDHPRSPPRSTSTPRRDDAKSPETGRGQASKIYFNKMNHVNLALGDCPDFLFGAFTPPADRWAAVSKAAAAAAPLPSPPGSPAHASHGSPSAPQRDALCIEHLAMLDGALCRTYEARHNIWIR